MNKRITQLAAAAFLALASSATFASPSVNQSGYIVGDIQIAPRPLNESGSNQPEIRIGGYDANQEPQYEEDVSDPLVALPQLVWTLE